MPLQKDAPTEGGYPPHSGMQGPSGRILTGHTYPDPAGTHTLQAFNPYNGYPQPSPTDAMAIEPNNHPLPDCVRNDMSPAEPHHGTVHYSQSRATLLVMNIWGGHGVSPYAANMPNDGITLDLSLHGNDF